VNGGVAWTRLKANLPDVAVHDLTIHPRENDLVIGTYGRALWTGDITPLQDLHPEKLKYNVYLFDIEPRARYGFSTQGMNYHLFGDKYLEVANEPDALVVNYFLAADASSPAKITVTDLTGRPLRQIAEGPGSAGVNGGLVKGAGGAGFGGGGGGGAAGGAGGRGRAAGAGA